MAGPDSAFVLQFETSYDLKFQQLMARLENDVRVKPASNSTMTAFGLMDPSDVQDITGVRLGLTQWSQDLSSRRWAVKRDYAVNKALDQSDDLAIILDLQMGYMANAIGGMNRKKDKVLIDAVTGIAQAGVNGTDTATFDTAAPNADGSGGNQIAVGTTGLTPDKMREARAVFDAREVGLDGLEMGLQEFVWVTSPKGHRDMMEFTEATTTDYLGVQIVSGELRTSRMPLVHGRIPYYMGFRIKISNQLNTTSSNRLNLAWHKDAMGFGRWGAERKVRTAELIEHNLAMGLVVQEHFGATRIQDKGVLAIVCDET